MEPIHKFVWQTKSAWCEVLEITFEENFRSLWSAEYDAIYEALTVRICITLLPVVDYRKT